MTKQNTSEINHKKLTSLLETLLPGNKNWPGASELNLCPTVVSRLCMAEGHTEAIARLLQSLPEEFTDAPAETRERILRPHESTEDFNTTLLIAYDSYYLHERVRDLLEKRCGYVTRPPQPEGFKLEPFEESRLKNTREREPFWRRA